MAKCNFCNKEVDFLGHECSKKSELLWDKGKRKNLTKARQREIEKRKEKKNGN